MRELSSMVIDYHRLSIESIDNHRLSSVVNHVIEAGGSGPNPRQANWLVCAWSAEDTPY